MILSELLDLLEKYVNDDSLDRWDEDTRIRFLNIWYKKILNEENWYFLIATDTSITATPATSTYAKPALMQTIEGIWLDTIKPEFKLSEITRKERETRDWTQAGRPQHFFLQGSSINVLPIPDASYNLQIEYIPRIPDLIALTDTPVFDDDFHYLIPLGAAASLKKTSGGSQINEGDNLVQEYLAGMDRMKKQLGSGAEDRPLAVKNTWDLYQRDEFSNT